MLLPDVPLVLRGVRNLQSLRYDRVVVGVITNSDDRVPDILASLGVKVGPWRCGQALKEVDDGKGNWDVDFAVMSYDAGFEKPDRRIFDAAVKMVEAIRGSEEAGDKGTDSSSWEKVYVGDEHAKDVVGAKDAGWNAVLIADGEIGAGKGVEWRDEDRPGTLVDLFQTSRAVGFKSLTKLAEWLR